MGTWHNILINYTICYTNNYDDFVVFVISEQWGVAGFLLDLVTLLFSLFNITLYLQVGSLLTSFLSSSSLTK